ncbi:MAG: DNA mismatch repair endonuclease MutL [Dehalococcoidia bacterium]|nr:DNA mismatch repair endonuclease MutL [Dehalococcoidia bacterium]
MAIQVLDEHVIARIAAGEVIERPASVVKELVENAIDAGATQISIEIQGGGLELIRVSDDGCGIATPELETAFLRHATSKIRRFEDMFTLHSLGFRGEALPSIAAVADVEVTSCPSGSTAGMQIKINGGKKINTATAGRAPGTTFSATGLFQSVPARLKFLKSRQTENSHTASVISRYALAYPEVKFSLAIDGRNALSTPGSGRLEDAIISVYGIDVAREMLEVSEDSGDTKISGMAAGPAISRANNSFINLFVNRRWVTSRRLVYAVEEAYHGLLMTGRHPLAVVNIWVPPQDVDVNIHPTKSEVKFRDESVVFSAVQKAVRRALVQSTPVPRASEASAIYKTAPLPQIFNRQPHTPIERHGYLYPTPAIETTPLPPPKMTLPALRLLGQFRNSYIIAEGPDGLYLIDQHAAHERVLFEKLRREKTQGIPEVQALLTPETMEVTPAQSVILEAGLDGLAEYGFHLEDFGANTYLVRTIPAMLADKNWKAMLTELLDTAGKERSQFMERLSALTACHSAVKFGQSLSAEEMRELLRLLEQADLPNACPHGRPTIVCLPTGQLEKEFRRG